MPATWFDATVTRLEDASPRVRRFWLRLPDGLPPFTFRAGQFITLDLPLGSKRLQRWRSYSIASAPGEAHELLELCIVRMEGGLATNYLFDEIGVGSTLRFKGPEGTFVLPESVDQDLVLVCTGTGVAPFRSMLRDLDQRGWPARRVHLIYGSRTREDLLYADEFLDLAARQPLFAYSAALSRLTEAPSEDWISKGYVHEVYSRHYPNPAPDRRFLLCGWTAMIDQAVETILLRLGYSREQISYELYG
jgi:ferredoxin-NADP reductase